MRYGVNLLYLLPTIVGGTELYAKGLLRGLVDVDGKDEFVVFVNREGAEWPLPDAPNLSRVVCPVEGTNRGRRYIYEQTALPQVLRKQGIDAIHSLGYVGPVIAPCPTVITLHDTSFVDQGRTLSVTRQIALGLLTRVCSARAAHVIVDSQFSKMRIQNILRVPEDRITVIHLAAATSVCSSPSPDWSEVAACYGISKPYLVCFGGSAVHKNIVRLVRAFGRTCASADHELVIVGHIPADAIRELRLCASDLRSRIRSTGFVPPEHVGPLLAGAEVFVLPSLYEGFGMPVLEAQLAGTVVACSNAGAIPEVAGQGAEYFDPLSVDDIAKTIDRCVRDISLRQRMVARGRENAMRFSWTVTARATLSVYRAVLEKYGAWS